MLEGQILGAGQGAARCQYTLDYRVVGHIQEHSDALQRACLLKGALEIVGDVVLYAHCAEHDSEVLSVLVGDLCLTDDLHRKLVVGKTRAREDRQLLASDKGHERIYGRDARIYIVPRVLAGNGVQRQAVDVLEFLGIDVTEAVDRLSCSAEYASQHFL